MIQEYENLVTGDNPDDEIIYTDENELLGACELMGEDELKEAWEENPEILGMAMGGFFSRLRKRIRSRRKYRKSLRGLSRRARRKALRAYRKKAVKKARQARRQRWKKAFKKIRVASTAFIPGGRFRLAIMRRRAKRAGIPLAQYMKQRRRKRFKKIGRGFKRFGSRLRSRIQARRSRRKQRRSARREARYMRKYNRGYL